MEGKQKETQDKLDIENHKPEEQKCASCIASLAQELASYEMLKWQLESEIVDLRCQIENRIKQYNLQLQERIRSGEQAQSMNEGMRGGAGSMTRWTNFNKR